MPLSPFIRLASCRNLIKCSMNVLGWNSFRSLAYTTCSDVSDSSSDASHPLEKVGKSKVSDETLYQLKRGQNSAFIFISQLERSGFKHDLETYMSVVRVLCHWDWGMDLIEDEDLNYVIDNTNWKVESFEKISYQLLDVLIEENLIKAIEVLVELYANAGRFDSARYTLYYTKANGGLTVSTRTCNFVMNELIKQDKVGMIESYYRDLKSYGLIPNVNTYGIRIKGLCMNGCLKEAGDVFDEMEEAGVEPNAFVHNTYIHGLCCKGETELAFEIVKDLKESNQPVDDVFAYSCVITGFVKDSKIEDANDAFLDMKLRGVVPDRYCYGILIGGYGKKGDIVEALVLCKEMESRGIKTDDVVVRWVMQYFCGIGMYNETLHMFKHVMQQSGVILDEFSFNIAIGVARKLGKTDDAMGLVEEMEARKIMPIVIPPLGSEPTGFRDQWVQPNVGQDEGDEGVHVGVGCPGLFRTILKNLALHKLTSLNAPHSTILKKGGITGKPW